MYCQSCLRGLLFFICIYIFRLTIKEPDTFVFYINQVDPDLCLMSFLLPVLVQSVFPFFPPFLQSVFMHQLFPNGIRPLGNNVKCG